jgi:uncharacterized protein (TIGR03032 family)
MNVDVATQDTATTFRQSDGLLAFLAAHGVSILFSSYQSGLLYTLRHSAEGEGAVYQFALGQPLDICVNDGTNPSALFATELPHHSYRGPWRPPFIPALADEDRCQINGLAMEGGQPAYVSAIIRSDTIDGWLDREYHGGVVLDARSGKIVCEGLSKPHAPRLHKGELWVLNSGTGELGVVAGAASGRGTFEPRVFCPGFARELVIYNDFAFVGLSKPQFGTVEGVTLDQRLHDVDSEAWCGIQIIDLAKGVCAEWFRIDGAVTEIFDVAVIRG